MGWSPLWDKLLMSSVWSESKDVKILWITLLALKNRHGEVFGSIVGLAKQAVLTLDETKAAMDVLVSPDPHTMTAEYEGRRVEVIPGGWKILNHDKYRKMIQEEYKKEYNAAKQRVYRARKKEMPKGPPKTMEEKLMENGMYDPAEAEPIEKEDRTV